MMKRFDRKDLMQVGGQAVLEGVMIRAPGVVATAVRDPAGKIVVKRDRFDSFSERIRLFKLPGLRGALGLVEMIVVGIRALNYSAEVALGPDDGIDGRNNGNGRKKPGSERAKDAVMLGVMVAASLLLGLAVFFVAPLLLTTAAFGVEQDPLLFNLIAGGVRIGFFVAYLAFLTLVPDFRRLFEYHGAEHKTVFAFERGEELGTAAALRQPRFHPRCGTSFLFIVMCIAVVALSVLDAFVIELYGGIDLATRLLTHLPLIPLIGGISYEVIKASAKLGGTVVGRLMVAPGLWLQRITTREPDERQLEVALAALRCAIGMDSAGTADVKFHFQEELSMN
jgi:uncharacterized protein YqhQ